MHSEERRNSRPLDGVCEVWPQRQPLVGVEQLRLSPAGSRVALVFAMVAGSSSAIKAWRGRRHRGIRAR